MTRWQKFQDWMDSGEGGLAALIFMIAIFAFTGNPGLLPWASFIYGMGMYLLLTQINRDKKALKQHLRLTNTR